MMLTVTGETPGTCAAACAGMLSMFYTIYIFK